MCGPGVLCRLRLPVRPFPLGTALPAPRTLSGSDALTILGPSFDGASLGRASPEPSGPPTFLTLLSTPPPLFVDPDRPSGRSPTRVLCGGFWCVQPIAVGLSRATGAVSSFRECGLPCGLRGALCTLHLCRSAFSLRHRCPTRYGWLVRPCPVGTFTLQETPSFAWRTNASAQPLPEAGVGRSEAEAGGCRLQCRYRYPVLLSVILNTPGR
jgi:hypothetical protein